MTFAHFQFSFDISPAVRGQNCSFLIKTSNLAGLLTSVRQIFPDLELCQILIQSHRMCMSKICHTMPLHGNEADAKFQFVFGISGTTMPSVMLF